MADQRDAMRSCRVCGEIMNGLDRQPVCLPGCGHSFCRACLIMINNVHGVVKCPTCRSLHRGLPPEELPVNWALLALLEPDEEEGNKNKSGASPSKSDEAPSKNSNEAPSSPSGNCYGNNGLKDKHDPRSKGSCSSGSNQEDSDNSSGGGAGSKILKGIGIAAAATVGGVGLVAAAPVVLTGVGFTSAGVAAGSWAAGMMSSAAIANGGGVAAGSLVALLQSAGAAGIGTAATATLGGTGAGVGAGIGYGISKLFGRSSSASDEATCNQNSNTCTDDNDDGNEGNESTCNGNVQDDGGRERRSGDSSSKGNEEKDESDKGSDEDDSDKECEKVEIDNVSETYERDLIDLGENLSYIKLDMTEESDK